MNLLIVPCGQRKRKFKFRAPAVDVYDGPTYKVLRKFYQKELYTSNLSILILSAKYGFISPYTFIEHYDQKMTVERARELRNENTEFLRSYVTKMSIKTVYCSLSKLYLEALDLETLNLACPFIIELRGLGHKLAFVKKVVTKGSV